MIKRKNVKRLFKSVAAGFILVVFSLFPLKAHAIEERDISYLAEKNTDCSDQRVVGIVYGEKGLVRLGLDLDYIDETLLKIALDRDVENSCYNHMTAVGSPSFSNEDTQEKMAKYEKRQVAFEKSHLKKIADLEEQKNANLNKKEQLIKGIEFITYEIDGQEFYKWVKVLYSGYTNEQKFCEALLPLVKKLAQAIDEEKIHVSIDGSQQNVNGYNSLQWVYPPEVYKVVKPQK